MRKDEEVVADLLIQKTASSNVDSMRRKVSSFMDEGDELGNEIQNIIYTTDASSINEVNESTAGNQSSSCMIKNIKRFMSECMNLLSVKFNNNQYNMIIVILMSVALVLFIVLIVLFFGNLKRTTASTDLITDDVVLNDSATTILSSIRHLDLISQASTSTLPSMFINEDKSTNVIVKSMKSIDLESTDSVRETQVDKMSKQSTHRGSRWLFDYLVAQKNKFKWRRDTNNEENTYL